MCTQYGIIWYNVQEYPFPSFNASSCYSLNNVPSCLRHIQEVMMFQSFHNNVPNPLKLFESTMVWMLYVFCFKVKKNKRKIVSSLLENMKLSFSFLWLFKVSTLRYNKDISSSSSIEMDEIEPIGCHNNTIIRITLDYILLDNTRSFGTNTVSMYSIFPFISPNSQDWFSNTNYLHWYQSCLANNQP